MHVSDRMSIERLRFYERECRLGRFRARDPLTQRELAALEQTFRNVAADIEARETNGGAHL